MIEEIRISDLGVIGQAQMALGPGLTVLTGETGAGKTMVLTALSLLLGGKADPATVRVGAPAAAVEGRVHLDGHPDAIARVTDAGAELDDDGSLVLLRTVTAAGPDSVGRSRAHLGGRSVPQGVLAEIADALVTVHGQADQLRLRTPAAQREALDEFVGPEHRDRLAAYRVAWTTRAQVDAELTELVERAQDRSREAELLRLGLAEVERIDPQPEEDVALADEAERLTHAEDLRSAASAAHGALAGEDEAGEAPAATLLVDAARRLLDQAGAHDPTLAALATRVAEAGYLLADVATDLAGYLQDLQADPARLEAVQSRRAELATLTRSHGGDVAGVLAWARQAGLRLLELEDDGGRIEALRTRRTELDAEVQALATEIGAARRAAATRLAESVTAELAGLAMAGARLEVVVEDADEPSVHGAAAGAARRRPGATARQGGVRRRVVPRDAGDRGVVGDVGRRSGADPGHLRVRRGGRRRGRQGGSRGRTAPGAARPVGAGARRHPPGAGRRVRGHASRGDEVHGGRARPGHRVGRPIGRGRGPGP